MATSREPRLPVCLMTSDHPAESDAQVTEQILDVFAKEARIARSRLILHESAEELGVGSLDLAMAVFEIEDRFDVQLPEVLAGGSAPTVGELVQQVLRCIRERQGAPTAAIQVAL